MVTIFYFPAIQEDMGISLQSRSSQTSNRHSLIDWALLAAFLAAAAAAILPHTPRHEGNLVSPVPPPHVHKLSF